MTGRGTSREYAMGRLRRKAPELHQKVMAGEMSAYAAMVEAGLASPRFTVVQTSVDGVVATLRRHLPPEMLAEVVDKLSA